MNSISDSLRLGGRQRRLWQIVHNELSSPHEKFPAAGPPPPGGPTTERRRGERGRPRGSREEADQTGRTPTPRHGGPANPAGGPRAPPEPRNPPRRAGARAAPGRTRARDHGAGRGGAGARPGGAEGAAATRSRAPPPPRRPPGRLPGGPRGGHPGRPGARMDRRHRQPEVSPLFQHGPVGGGGRRTRLAWARQPFNSSRANRLAALLNDVSAYLC